MADSLLLTDDELAALAARRPAPWPSGLPTVAGDDDAVRAAVFRGNRSLLVRGIHPGEGDAGGPLGPVDEVFGVERRSIVYLGDADLRRSSWGLATAHYRLDDDRWLMERISPIGIHEFEVGAPSAQREHLAGLLRTAHDTGPQDPGEDDVAQWLCVALESPDDNRIIAAHRAAAFVVDVEVNGGESVMSDRLTVDIDDVAGIIDSVLA